MGFTPLEGLIMATRPGDVDVGVVLDLIERGESTLEEVLRVTRSEAMDIGDPTGAGAQDDDVLTASDQ